MKTSTAVKCLKWMMISLVGLVFLFAVGYGSGLIKITTATYGIIGLISIGMLSAMALFFAYGAPRD